MAISRIDPTHGVSVIISSPERIHLTILPRGMNGKKPWEERRRGKKQAAYLSAFYFPGPVVIPALRSYWWDGSPFYRTKEEASLVIIATMLLNNQKQDGRPGTTKTS